MITFTQWNSTPLYKPDSTANDGGNLLFLLIAGTASSTITIDKTWGAQANYCGFFLFLSSMPASVEAFANLITAALATALGHAPSTIQHSSFAWVSVSGSTPSVAAAAEISLQNDQPALRTSIAINMPAPFDSLPLISGTRVGAITAADGSITDFVLSYPLLPALHNQPAAQPPDGRGLTLALQGGGRGTIQCFALFTSQTAPESESSVNKDLYAISLDPVAPFDANRTYMTLTDQTYRLALVDDHYTITPV